MDLWLQLIGWYVAEGSGARAVTLSLNSVDGGRECAEVALLLDKLGLKYVTYPSGPAAGVRIYDARLARWFQANCGVRALKKRAPEFIGGLSARQIRLFLQALYAGDGQRTPTAHILTTTSAVLADQVQEMLLKVGDASKAQYVAKKKLGFLRGRSILSRNPAHYINWLTRSSTHHTSCTTIEEWVEYSGVLYSLSGNLQTIFVRRHGQAVWSGGVI
jgi:hypothetical protein